MAEIIYADRAEWVADSRATAPEYSIGGSTIPAVLGVSPWQGPWDVYARARGEAVHGPETTVQARGIRLEPYLIDRYSEIRGVEVDARICRIVDPRRPWHRPSPDGRVDGGIVEVKTSSKPEDWGPDGAVIRDWAGDRGHESIPPYYALQAMSMIEASGADWCDFMVGLPSWQDLIEERILRLYRQPQIQSQVLDRVESWRDRHLVQGVPPDVDGSRPANRWLAGRQASKQYREADAAGTELCEQLRAAKSEQSRMISEVSRLQNRLIDRLGGDRGLQVAGPCGPYKAYLVSTAGAVSISLSRLKTAHPDWYDHLESEGLIRRAPRSAHIRFTNPNPKETSR